MWGQNNMNTYPDVESEQSFYNFNPYQRNTSGRGGRMNPYLDYDQQEKYQTTYDRNPQYNMYPENTVNNESELFGQRSWNDYYPHQNQDPNYTNYSPNGMNNYEMDGNMNQFQVDNLNPHSGTIDESYGNDMRVPLYSYDDHSLSSSHSGSIQPFGSYNISRNSPLDAMTTPLDSVIRSPIEHDTPISTSVNFGVTETETVSSIPKNKSKRVFIPEDHHIDRCVSEVPLKDITIPDLPVKSFTLPYKTRDIEALKLHIPPKDSIKNFLLHSDDLQNSLNDALKNLSFHSSNSDALLTTQENDSLQSSSKILSTSSPSQQLTMNPSINKIQTILDTSYIANSFKYVIKPINSIQEEYLHFFELETCPHCLQKLSKSNSVSEDPYIICLYNSSSSYPYLFHSKCLLNLLQLATSKDPLFKGLEDTPKVNIYNGFEDSQIDNHIFNQRNIISEATLTINFYHACTDTLYQCIVKDHVPIFMNHNQYVIREPLSDLLYQVPTTRFRMEILVNNTNNEILFAKRLFVSLSSYPSQLHEFTLLHYLPMFASCSPRTNSPYDYVSLYATYELVHGVDYFILSKMILLSFPISQDLSPLPQSSSPRTLSSMSMDPLRASPRTQSFNNRMMFPDDPNYSDMMKPISPRNTSAVKLSTSSMTSTPPFVMNINTNVDSFSSSPRSVRNHPFSASPSHGSVSPKDSYNYGNRASMDADPYYVSSPHHVSSGSINMPINTNGNNFTVIDLNNESNDLQLRKQSSTILPSLSGKPNVSSNYYINKPLTAEDDMNYKLMASNSASPQDYNYPYSSSSPIHNMTTPRLSKSNSYYRNQGVSPAALNMPLSRGPSTHNMHVDDYYLQQSSPLDYESSYSPAFPDLMPSTNTFTPHGPNSLMDSSSMMNISSSKQHASSTKNLMTSSNSMQVLSHASSINLPHSNSVNHMNSAVNDFDIFNTKYKGNVFELALTQQGSKNLQSFLNDIDKTDIHFGEIIDCIILEIQEHLYILVIDTFGNYFIQLLFSCCTEKQKVKILEALSDHFSEISKDKIGTFAIQNILDYCNDNKELGEIVINSLKDHVIDLVYDTRATHVVQRCIKLFKNLHISYLVDTLQHNCVSAATNRNGSMVLRLCLDVVDKDVKQLLSTDLIESAVTLAGHPVGNYVIQHLLEANSDGGYQPIDLMIIHSILYKLQGSYVELSKQKFSSNVVEKCLMFIKENEYRFILDELFEPKAFVNLLCNHFGCYVLQRAISLPIYYLYHETIYSLIYDNFELLNAHGNNMLSKWKQVLNRYQDYNNLFDGRNQ